MPIYEYECTKCHHIFEDWCKSVAEGNEDHFCPECKSSANRIISHTSFALKGGGWYATEYGTMKKNPDTSSAESSNAAKAEPSSSTVKVSNNQAGSDASSSTATSSKDNSAASASSSTSATSKNNTGSGTSSSTS